VSDLIAIAYPDQAAVERAEDRLRRGVREGLIQVEDVVVIVRNEDGTVEVRQGSTGVAMAAVGGAMWGGLIGLVFLAPLLGMAVGAIGGGAMWKSMFGDVGVAQKFVNELGGNLRPGSAALILLVREMDPTRVLPHIQEHGHVIQTSLNPAVEAQLDAAVAAAGPERSTGRS
jgi:uncharacterized membrane protein